MSEKIFDTRIITKHETEEQWLQASDFIPFKGEFILYDIDATHSEPRIKIGDGVTPISTLPFYGEGTLSNNMVWEDFTNNSTSPSNNFWGEF